MRQWFADIWEILRRELRHILTDEGVITIFFIAGLLYPALYGIIYSKGNLNDMPVAVVDDSGSIESRRFIRKVDATRECAVTAFCANMQEAEALMQSRDVHGIIRFPSDYADRIAMMEQATISTYADMSSFLYYKNLMIGSNLVMLSELEDIQYERYGKTGLDHQSVSQMIDAMPVDENMPYNKSFSYAVFFLSAALLLVIQQTMFYGMSMLAGTKREQGCSLVLVPEHLRGKRGIMRSIFGRGLAYWLVYIIIGCYVAFIVPLYTDMPRRGDFFEIFGLLMLYVAVCILFCFTFSSIIKSRETVFLMLLFFSPILMFLTGFSWPTSSFPDVWRYFSYIFPSTLAIQGFINLNTAGGDLSSVSFQINGLCIQAVIYFVTSYALIWRENHRA